LVRLGRFVRAGLLRSGKKGGEVGEGRGAGRGFQVCRQLYRLGSVWKSTTTQDCKFVRSFRVISEDGENEACQECSGRDGVGLGVWVRPVGDTGVF
jgi:hypothetical protein